MNRLKLDFNLNTNVERTDFIKKYVNEIEFVPTEDELDLMAKYILWGKDPETGLNSVQDGTVELTQKHEDWAKTAAHPTESLDGLIESPAFSESSIKSLTSTHYTARNSKLSRSEMRRLAANRPSILSEFESLWAAIDRLDLQIELYELSIGKRTKEIRENLLAKFSAEDIENLRSDAAKWTQYQYLKKRHLLVDLRSQQYTLKDTISQPIGYGTPSVKGDDQFFHDEPITWETDVAVLPLGLYDSNWDRRDHYINYQIPSTQFTIDLRDDKIVYQLLNAYQELDESYDNSQLENNSNQLLQTLNWYIDQADLSPVYSEVLQRKLKHEKNADIAIYVNGHYGKKYTENYISTILTQKVVPKITEQVKFHELRNQNWNNPDMFKTCVCCGRTYLRTADFFVRKARSNDGLNNKCKKCDKKTRDERKMIEYYGGKK